MKEVSIKENFEWWDELINSSIEVDIFVILLSAFNSHFVFNNYKIV